MINVNSRIAANNVRISKLEKSKKRLLLDKEFTAGRNKTVIPIANVAAIMVKMKDSTRN